MMTRKLFLLILLFLWAAVVIASAKRARKLEYVNNDPYWLNYFENSEALSSLNGTLSYLWTTEDIELNPQISFMNKVIKMLYLIQNPSRKDCSSRKMVVLQMRGNSFEGTGSLLKQVLLGIAVAAHSNRTLVWGLGLPYIYEHSQEIWQGEDNNDVRFHSGSISLDCSSPDPTGGAYKCFFERMTSCTLADVNPQEIMSYSINPYNDTDRLIVGDISRRGVALFHPPEGLFEFILKHQDDPMLSGGAHIKQSDIAQLEPNLWVAAVAAYVFRLKPDVVSQYAARYDKDFGANSPRPLWGFHVRHGDLKVMPLMYHYKTIFDFPEFFKVARDISHVVKAKPSRLFISSDSPDIHHIDKIYSDFVDSEGESIEEDPGMISFVDSDVDDLYYDDVELDVVIKKDVRGREVVVDANRCNQLNSSLDVLIRTDPMKIQSMKVDKFESICKNWYSNGHPKVFSLGNDLRYRTYHGSHTVAANGGCQKDENYDKRGMKCSLNFDTIVQYQSNETHLSTPRPNRIFRAYAEAVEDIYLLSLSDVFFGQGSSYFSTLAGYLVWARTGCKDFRNTVIFLDLDHCIAGLHPSAHLHGMNLLNTTFGYDPSLVKDAGIARWKIHTDNFLPALKSYATGKQLDFNPWDKKNYMKYNMDNLVPQLPEYFFYNEARSWKFTSYKPVWAGSCPTMPAEPINNLDNFILDTSNMGNSMHEAVLPGQAAQCWTVAKELAEREFHKLVTIEGNSPNDLVFLNNALEVLRGNLKSLMLMSYADIVINEEVRKYFQVDEGSGSKRVNKQALLPPGFMSQQQEQLRQAEVLYLNDESSAGHCFDRINGAIQWVRLGNEKNLLNTVDSIDEIDALLEYFSEYKFQLQERRKELQRSGDNVDQSGYEDSTNDDSQRAESDSPVLRIVKSSRKAGRDKRRRRRQ